MILWKPAVINLQAACISEMSDSYVKSPSEIVSVGDIVKVKVIKIDQERKKVGLSMKIS